MKTFIEIFDSILTGNKDESYQAAGEVRKLLRSSRSDGRGKYDDIKTIIENAPYKYLNIEEEWREENFVRAVSVLYFLHDKESQPDFLFPWLFYLFKHQNGNIKHAASRMLENELGPLTVHIRCPGKKFGNQLSPEQADAILRNLFVGLNILSVDFWKPAYEKHLYISSLPTSPYKTIQMIMCEMEDACGKAYMKQLRSKLARKR